MKTAASFEDTPLSKVSEYWNARPCNIRHSPKPVGIARILRRSRSPQVFRRALTSRDSPSSSDGRARRCSKSDAASAPIPSVSRGTGAQVPAVDLTEKSLELARQRARVFGLEDASTFLQANAEKLSDYVPVEPYDLVYSFGVIHHTPHPDRVLEEIRKYVTPESTVKIMVYNRWSWKVLWILFVYGKGQFWKLNRLIAEYSEAQTGCPVTYSYSRTSGRRWLEEHGFRVTDVMVDHIFPYSIPEYVQYQYRKVWYFRWMPNFLFRALERAFGWHLCLTAKLK